MYKPRNVLANTRVKIATTNPDAVATSASLIPAVTPVVLPPTSQYWVGDKGNQPQDRTERDHQADDCLKDVVKPLPMGSRLRFTFKARQKLFWVDAQVLEAKKSEPASAFCLSRSKPPPYCWAGEIQHLVRLGAAFVNPHPKRRVRRQDEP